MEKGTVKVKFGEGFGNNLFRYCFCRLLAEHHDLNFSHPAIPELNIKAKDYPFNRKLKTIKFKAKSNLEAKKFDNNFNKYFKSSMKNCNFDFYKFIFYFEDYTIYKPFISKIKSWFPKVEKNNFNDLVIHLRLQNRIVQKTHYINAIKPEIYRKTIQKYFKFDKLYIVTDSFKWDYFDEKDILFLMKNYKKRQSSFIPVKQALRYINSIVNNFKELNPIIINNKELIKDFNFISSFDQIIFKNSTFAWWAAALSEASKVGVFGPWKPNKKKRNKNLGTTNFPGWFSWGKENDLISYCGDKKYG
jgi:hypothetical protein